MTKAKKVGLIAVLAVPAICAVGGFLAAQKIFGSAAGSRDAELAEARKLGIPLEPADVAPMTYVPDRDNAAPIYDQAQRLVESSPLMKRDLNDVVAGFGPRAKPKDHEAMLAALARIGPLLTLVEKGADKPGCDFRRNWGKGPSLLFPEYATLKNWAKALCAKAEIQSSRGDWKGALKSIDRAGRIATHCGNDPILIGFLVDIAVQKIALASLQRIVESHSRDGAFLAAARKRVEGFVPLPSIRRAMMGEVMFGRSAIPMIDSHQVFGSGSGAPSKPTSIERSFFQSSLVQNAFDAKFVHEYRLMIADLPENPADWQKATLVVGEAERRVAADRSLANMANQILLPVFSGAPRAVGSLVSQRRLLQTAIRLAQERVRTGTTPRMLPDWGEVRIDPFSGKPFRYRREGVGILIYGYGQDGVDDDGLAATERNGASTWDDVVRIK
jgi:hypothetical protein